MPLLVDEGLPEQRGEIQTQFVKWSKETDYNIVIADYAMGSVKEPKHQLI